MTTPRQASKTSTLAGQANAVTSTKKQEQKVIVTSASKAPAQEMVRPSLPSSHSKAAVKRDAGEDR